MSKIKSHVLKNIKQNGLEPTSKFYFVTRNYFFALLFIVSVVVGAVSFSAILHDLVVGSQFYGLTQQIDNVMKAYIPLYRVTIEERLERNAAYLEKKHLNERAIMMMLERERLRTLCLNQQRNDCFDQEIRVNIKVKENSN